MVVLGQLYQVLYWFRGHHLNLLTARTDVFREGFISRFYFRHHNIFPSSFVTEAEKFGWSFVFEMFVAKEVAEKITQSVKGKFGGIASDHAKK